MVRIEYESVKEGDGETAKTYFGKGRYEPLWTHGTMSHKPKAQTSMIKMVYAHPIFDSDGSLQSAVETVTVMVGVVLVEVVPVTLGVEWWLVLCLRLYPVGPQYSDTHVKARNPFDLRPCPSAVSAVVVTCYDYAYISE